MRHEETCIGNIEVITGPMFAGKSEELLRRINRLKYAKKKFLVFKPKIDNRYSDDEVVSHQKRAYKCISISSAHEIYSYLTESLDCVCIDEVQFFDDEMTKLDKWAEDRKNSLEIELKQLDKDIKTLKTESKKILIFDALARIKENEAIGLHNPIASNGHPEMGLE